MKRLRSEEVTMAAALPEYSAIFRRSDQAYASIENIFICPMDGL
jgi:hypothetical protein